MASSIKEALDAARKLKHEKIINKKSDEELLLVLEVPPVKKSKAKKRHYQKNSIPVFIKPSVRLPSRPENKVTTKTHIGNKEILTIDRTRHGPSQLNLLEKSITPAKVDGGTVKRQNKNGQLQALKAEPYLLDMTCYGPRKNDMDLLKIQQVKTDAAYTLDILPNAQLMFGNAESVTDDLDLLLIDPKLLHHAPQSDSPIDRPLTVGIDFGTSCVKCVIGDRNNNKYAYAIPFLKGIGINSYLLPSLLYEEDGVFSLSQKGIVHNNLKLGFLDGPNNTYCQVHMVAFMALVIRHSLAWFLSEYKNDYLNSNILWALNTGVPTPQNGKSSLIQRYKHLARAAWYVAWGDFTVSKQNILTSMNQASMYREDVAPLTVVEDVEIDAIPEIAAQIHGFVEATGFDPKSRNIFLMVDVGAGTVDSSLFHVKKEKVRTSFSFFESQVGSYGAMNLHRARVNWWKGALDKKGPKFKPLLDAIDKVALTTESKITPPQQLQDYFTDTKLHFNNASSPDDKFSNELRALVIKSYKSSFKGTDSIVAKNNLYGIDAFLCGGGFKLPFYNFIERAIYKVKNASYLHAIPKKLEIPANFVASAVLKDDYNRLSVAYGLCFVKANILEVKPFVGQVLTSTRNNLEFVDKDQV